MKTLFFDMDGVLVDLYGFLSREWGITSKEVQTHSPRIFRMYTEWLHSFGSPAEAFLSLPPLYPDDMKRLILDTKEAGFRVEILTHLGIESPHQVEWGKRQWLDTHFRSFVRKGVISQVNCVVESSEKALFAGPGALLVDDNSLNVAQFRGAGGQAVLYQAETHRESIAEVRQHLSL